MISSIDAEKRVGKLQYIFMVKNKNKNKNPQPNTQQ